MRTTSFLLAWCLTLFAYGTVACVDCRTASADDCVAQSCTASCNTCDAGIFSGVDSACDPGYLFPQSDCGVNLRGWVNGGFIGNTSDPDSKFNGPYNAVDRSNELMMNQLYMIAERALPDCGWGLGVRADVIYGEDFWLAESTGFERSPTGHRTSEQPRVLRARLSSGLREHWEPGPVVPGWPLLFCRRI